MHTRLLHPLVRVAVLALSLLGAARAEDFPRISAQRLPSALQAFYARDRPELGAYGHCATAYDSEIDGSKMAWSCAIYVRLSAQGERLAMKLCAERAALLKIKAPCRLVVEP